MVLSKEAIAQNYIKQNTYIDALRLKDIFNQNANIDKDKGNDKLLDEFCEILSKYNIDCKDIESNIFFKGYTVTPNNRSITSEEIKLFESTATTLQSVDWQSNAIAALSTFMANRFKQEILQVSIDQMFTKINKEEETRIIKFMFPKTFKYIDKLVSNKTRTYYTTDLMLLRQTAQIDIEDIPNNVVTYIDSILPKADDNLKNIIRLAKYIPEKAKQGLPLDHLISALADETYSSNSKILKIIHLTDLLAQSSINIEGARDKWVNPYNLSTAPIDWDKNLQNRFFYGLLYQQLLEFPEIKEYFDQSNSDPEKIAKQIQILLTFVKELNNTDKFTISKSYNLKTAEEAITYIRDINNVYKSILGTLKSIPSLESKFDIERLDINKISRFTDIIAMVIKKEYINVIPLFVTEFGELNESYRTITFISQMATVQSADDMEKLLNAYALPIGSSSIKRNSNFNISLNGYVGLTGGIETALGSHATQSKGNIGLAAPIGIATTFLDGKVTAFVSIIDLGSIVNIRLNNDTTMYSNLKFEHFITPGLGLFYNVPKLPITFGFHANYIPNLRTIKYKVEESFISETNRTVFRFNFSLLVDIPFFTLFDKGVRK